MKKYIAALLFFSCLAYQWAGAQNCTANLGSPLINITFGAGSDFGQPLAPGATGLTYVAAACPTDGQYSIANSVPGCTANGWQAVPNDHTGDYEGYFMLVNGSSSASDLYVQTVKGFCQGTTYQFAAWMLNMAAVPGGNTSPNIRFNIEKTDGTVLQTYTTGALPVDAPAHWTQYAFYYTIPPGLSSAVLRITNLGAGGAGNDLALDDISFRAAGPTVDLQASAFPGNAGFVCTGSSVSFSSNVSSCYSSTAFQWQRSLDNGITWSDIPGATGTGYNTTFTAAGTFLYRVRVAESGNIGSNFCSVFSNPITVVAEDGPATALGITPSANSICAGTPVTFTANPTGGGPFPFFLWQVNGKAVSTGSSSFTSNSLSDGDVVTCVMTSSAPCAHPGTLISNAVKISVIALTSPSISISPPASTTCAGTPVTFTASAVNGGSSPVYQWQVNGANVGSGSNTFTSSSLADGDVITCTLTSNAPCTSPATAVSNAVTIRVTPPAPSAVSISASAQLVCAGTPVTFTAAAGNGGTAPQYQWLVNGAGVGSGGSSYTTGALANGDIVSCILTSNAACVSPATATSNTIQITIKATIAPSVTITPSVNPACAGAPVTFTATAANGGPAPQYRWQVNGKDIGATGSTFTSSAFVNGDIVSCTLTSNSDCASPAMAVSNAVTLSVTSSSSPSISIRASSGAICAGSPVTFTAAATGGGSAPTYRWQVNGKDIATTGSTFTSSSLSNNDIITCILTSNAACASPATATSNALTLTVMDISIPSVSIAPSENSICPGTAVIFMATLVNGGDAPVCQWQINGKDAGAGGIYYSSLNFANGDQVTCIMTSNATCASPATVISNAVTMAVKPPTPPAVTITPPAAPVCAGTPVTFTAAPVNGGAAPVYHWDVNGQDVGSGSSYTSSSLANGDRVSCVLTSNSTCASNVTATSNLVTLSVNSWSVPSVTISASADAVCAGMPVTFTPAAANSGTAPQYQWQVNGVNMGSGGSYTTSSLTSSDRVACSMVSNAACVSPATATSNTLTLSVTPSPTPSVTISASAGPVCEGTPVTFTAAATNGGNAPGYRWQVNGASVGTDGATYTSSTFSNNDIITCILTSNATCASPATVVSNPVAMTVYPLPVIAPGQVFYMYGGQPVTLNPVISGSIARFLWTPAAGLSVDTIRDPIASLPVSTLYTLEVQTTDGCQSSSIIKVEPVQKMGIPNAFTPNGDGNNDVFYVLGGPPGARVKNLAVFNRWGEQIFQVRDAAPGDRRFGWNGSYKGSPAPTGTYVYMIIVEFADATQQKFSGTVNLIR